ncbi:Isopentenyl-diphosphate delta-isomerase, partial [Trichostrongylus colubriformis]
MLAKEALLESYNPVQVGYLSEQCIAVDEDDNVVGKVAKGAAHRVDTLGLHRAFSLFAFTPEKKLILQKRSAEKAELNGGPGAVAAAVRKVEHELGVVDLKPEECRVMGRFLYKAVMNDSLWGEHELDYVVLTRDLSLSRVTLNPAEVSDVRTVDEQELAEWVK